MSNFINKLYFKTRIDTAFMNKALNFVNKIETLISSKTGQEVKLEMFGSLISGFGSCSSDLDLCIKLSGNIVADEVIQRTWYFTNYFRRLANIYLPLFMKYCRARKAFAIYFTNREHMFRSWLLAIWKMIATLKPTSPIQIYWRWRTQNF